MRDFSDTSKPVRSAAKSPAGSAYTHLSHTGLPAVCGILAGLLLSTPCFTQDSFAQDSRAQDSRAQDSRAVEKQMADLETAERARQGDYQQVYFITEGDTIKNIAKRFSDDPNFAAELLALNQIEESELQPGRPLVIPGPERGVAMRALEQAKNAMKQAVAANAAKFALEDFKDAVNIYDDGSNARNAGSYIRARLLGDLATERFLQAKEQADRKALETLPVKLTVLHGKVFVSTNNGLSYKTTDTQADLAAGNLIRTSEDGTARIEFEDASSLMIKPSSTLLISRYRKDSRSGKSQRILHLRAGEVEADVKPLTVADSEFFLLNGETRIALNNARVMARSTEDGRMIQCTFKGTADIAYQGSGFTQGTGAGSICTAKRGLEGPFPLNEAVDILSPSQSGLTTAEQQYTFEWRESVNHKNVEYKLEIARDTNFSDIVESVITPETSFQCAPLDTGTFYIRIGILDPFELPGFASEVITLNVKRNLDLELGYGLIELQLGEVTYVAPNARVIAVPASENHSISTVKYKIDDGAYFDSKDGVTLADSGSYTVHAQGFGIDRKGGTPVSKAVTIDSDPPELRVHVGELTEIPGYGTVRSVSFIADDNTQLRGVEYSLNGDEYKTYSAPLKLPVSKTFRIEARAIDFFGNISETVMGLERIKPRTHSKKDDDRVGLFNKLFGKKP